MRNIPNRGKDDQPPTDGQVAADATKPAMPGGAPGITPQAGDYGAMNGATRATYEAEEREGAPKQELYEVVTGGQIMYQGVRTTIKPGKVVHQGCYDLRMLMQQGIKLRKLAAGEVPQALPLPG